MQFSNMVIETLEVPNHNKRFYTKSLGEKIVNQFNSYDTNFGLIATDFVGAKIPLAKIAFSVKNLRIEDNKLIADIESLENMPNGKLIEEFKDKVSFHLSGIGDGKTNEDGIFVMNEEYYQFVCIIADLNQENKNLFNILERFLVDHNTNCYKQIDKIKASDINEATKLAKERYPNKDITIKSFNDDKDNIVIDLNKGDVDVLC